MSYYPIIIDLKGQKVVVVGGGSVAQRKIDALLECDAIVYLVAKELTPLLHDYTQEGRVKFLGRDFIETDLDGAFLVIAATDDAHLNHKISETAKEHGMLVNAVDQPEDCNFIVPSIVKRGDLLIAISTSGKSPALAKRIRIKLSEQFGNEYVYFLTLMGRLRKDIFTRGLSQMENSEIFQALVDSPALEAIAAEDWERVASILSKILGTPLSQEDVQNYIKG